MHDYTRFTKRIPIKASANEIYNLLTTQDGLEQWFLREAEFTSREGKPRDRSLPIHINDTYEWMWHGWGDEAVERGTVTNLNGTNHFEFTFGKAGVVTITIKEEQGENIVELLQENIPTDEESQWNYFIGCQTGWTFYLTNLKSILEGGIDLRNKDVSVKNVVNA